MYTLLVKVPPEFNDFNKLSGDIRRLSGLSQNRIDEAVVLGLVSGLAPVHLTRDLDDVWLNTLELAFEETGYKTEIRYI